MAVSDYEKLWRSVVGMVPSVDPVIAQKLTQRAWERIESAHDDWSFLTRHTLITTAAEIVAGTVTVTLGSKNVVVDATAKAAFDLILPATLLAGRSFRVGQSVSAGTYYEIASYDTGTSTLVLEVNYEQATASAQPYVVNNRIIDAPSDFKDWRSVYDPFNSRTIKHRTIRPIVDRGDPQRTSTDDPFWLVPHESKRSTGGFQYEWYPAPRQSLTYDAIYESAGIVLDPIWKRPVHLPMQFLERALLVEAYLWAEANRGRLEHLKGSDWRFLHDREEKKYNEQLQKSHLQDLNISGNNIAVPYTDMEVGGPGASYFQNHAPYRAG